MLRVLLINTRCDTAARYLVYSREPLATPSMGVSSLGLIINGCLQPSAAYFGLARPNYTWILPMALEAGRRR